MFFDQFWKSSDKNLSCVFIIILNALCFMIRSQVQVRVGVDNL